MFSRGDVDAALEISVAATGANMSGLNRTPGAARSFQRFSLFSLAIDASVGIFMGQTSTQDSDLEHVFPKCST